MRSAVRPCSRRSSHGAKTGKSAAALGDWVKVAPLKPAKAPARTTPGVLSAMSSTRRTTSVVRAREAPPGSWIAMIA